MDGPKISMRMLEKFFDEDSNDITLHDVVNAFPGEEPKAMLLDHIEFVALLAERVGFGKEEFWRKAMGSVNFITGKLNLTKNQAVILCAFLSLCDEERITINDLGEALKCGVIQTLKYASDIEELERRQFVFCRRRRDEKPSYRIPPEFISAVQRGEEYVSKKRAKLKWDELFSVMETLFERRRMDELTFDALVTELQIIMETNKELKEVKKFFSYKLPEESAVLLFIFCILYVQEYEEEVCIHDIEDYFEDDVQVRRLWKSLRNGANNLLGAGLVEHVCSGGFGDMGSFKLTEKAKEELLLDFGEKQAFNKKDFLLPEKIPEKKMIYNEKEQKSIAELTGLLFEENFRAVEKRLLENGRSAGFACLFYGPPGTGKTETVYQIAKRTGRAVMLVDIAETKSMWFGESERHIKRLFERYKMYVKKMENEGPYPILLFNEADGVISKRKDTASSSVAQTENAIQNIILQEMENLRGILIATTNLTQNLDKAFERRFLYKIEFNKPKEAVRKIMWQTLIPDIEDAEAQTLADRFDFSGGQMENISRRRTIQTILSGAPPGLDVLVSYCDDELLSKESKKIGFSG
ncbi:MAG: ATP-binding protein [Spirochaetaceae bacterium]|jgi:hypothetical protein|nr:ATP-binding protein [Spirochaetaceae bacterium]